MKILIACEESQAVTIEFRKLGHEAYSCDTEPCSGGHPEWHLQQDVIPLLKEKWDMLIAFPPCTYLSYAGMSSWNDQGRLEKRLDALKFFAEFWKADIEKICIENPRGCASPSIAKYSQEIEPYHFGEKYTKKTWLWLKNLRPLISIPQNDLFENPTHFKGEPETTKTARWYNTGGKNRQKNRSKTFPGIAKAMANQWG